MKPPMEGTISKSDYEKTVAFFEELLQLLHPFMPFVTEEIYHQLKERTEGDDLCVKQIMLVDNINNQILAEGRLLKEFITKIRNVRSRNNLRNKETISLTLINKDYFDAYGNIISPQFPRDSWREILKRQTNSSQINFNSIPYVSGTIVNETVEIFQCQIEFKKLVDNIESRKKIQEEVDHLERFLTSIEKKLNNPKFLQNAKTDVIATEKKKRSDTIEKIRVLSESISTISLEDFMNDESTLSD
jgi:valyl-tRNA synthetase